MAPCVNIECIHLNALIIELTFEKEKGKNMDEC